MKKSLSLVLSLLLLVTLVTGCSRMDGADYIGRYTLIPKGDECSSLVVHWVYPDDSFDAILETVTLDLSRIKKYVNPNADLSGGGVNLNNLLGTLGFGRSFLKADAIGIGEANAKVVAKKKPPIYLQIESTDGRSCKVRLEYDASIHD